MRTSHLALLTALTLIATTGCGGSDCTDTATCDNGGGTGGATGGTGGTSGTGGTTGGGGTMGGGGVSGSGATGGTSGAGGDGGTCDTSKSPSQEACLVDDQYGVFVDGTVSTTGDGSKASPFKTIAEGIAAAAGKMLFVCDTTYDEQVKLTAGAKIYGGFKCADWSYETGVRAVVQPSAKGYALDVDSVTESVVIEDVEFDAKDGTAAGESSVAGFVHGSSDVSFGRVKLVAGKGATGANGTLTAYTYPTQTDLNGNPANVLAGGALKQCACPAGDQSIGAHGGDGPTPSNGGNGLPALGGGQGGTAGTPTDCGNGGTGKNGNPGTPASNASGASTLGTLSTTGWAPANGATGSAGGPGQGGGGGASSAAGGGGGGGCGGCGGAAGPGGSGGGASIALLVLDSTVSADADSELVSGDGGDGGKGVAGQTGQSIYGFGGIQASGACGGGNGGPGGKGAAGGGGAGGISVPVVWKGAAAPNVDASATLTNGNNGAKGVGGNAGNNDGIDGVAQPTLEVT
jgi:hypothetical protein